MLLITSILERENFSLKRIKENNNKLKWEIYKCICSINISSWDRFELRKPVTPPPKLFSKING